MTTARSVKASRQTRPKPTGIRPARLVGVIASINDFRRAFELPEAPDLFEIRLDLLAGHLNELQQKFPRLAAPVIVTARDPREGGARNLSITRRQELLRLFLPHASYIDVELRSLRTFRPILELARRKKVRRIVSFHDLKDTPDLRTLRAKTNKARSAGADIFKVATRTDKPDQLARLLRFVGESDRRIAISAMGIGKLGAISRILLGSWGSALNYAAIGRSKIEGQLPIEQLRSVLPR